MWETFKTWFLANQDDILVPVVSGLILVFAIGLWKFFTKPQDEPAQPITLPTTDAQTAKELGVTEAALRNFFKILQENHVGADELDAKLREIAQRHKDLLERVAAIPDVDERANGLRDDAQAAIADGRYDDADEILRTAENQDLQAAAELEDQLHSRKMAVAASAFARGELAFSRFKYQDAGTHFLRAADHCPQPAQQQCIEALNMAGRAFDEAAVFLSAKNAFSQALTMAEKLWGDEAPQIAAILNNLGLVYLTTNETDAAESFLLRALAISEKNFDTDHSDIARDLNNLAGLYYETNRIKEAEKLFKRALEIDEKIYGLDHYRVATRLNNLAGIYQNTHRLEQAEPLFLRALAIDEKVFGPNHPNVAIDLSNLAVLYKDTNRLDQAEPLMQRALVIDEKALGPVHSKVARNLNNLAGLYQATKRLELAEPLFVRAVGIFTASLGTEHPDTLVVTENLTALRREMAARDD